MAHERGGDVQSAGDVVGSLLGGPLGHGLGPAQRAARAWYAANGDRERAHTTGVWLRKPGRADRDPVLVVELDASWLAGELSTNKDLYLSRLAFRGVHVSDIRFRVGQRPGRHSADCGRGDGAPGACPPLPQLTPEERAHVERATSGLPDGLKQSVSRAMCASFAREKANHT